MTCERGPGPRGRAPGGAAPGLRLSLWQNIEYIVPTFASGCQYATYCNICKGWRGSTSHMLSIFARVRQGPACGQKPSNMGSENSSKSLRKRFQTTLNRLKSLDPGLRHRDTGSIFNMCQHLQVIGLGQHSILLTTFARERRQYPTPTFAPESSINCQRVTHIQL